jgi:mitochondrial enoyl-[acyl-carrier protein] reductase / trans-2-enoyl-CoA reductase
MKAICYARFGAPEEVLELVDLPLPVPGPGEVRIRLEASPCHLADLKHIRGLPWFDQYRPPHAAGYEGVGRVSAIGPGVTGWREGERVFLPVRFGAWQEESLAEAEGLWRAPEQLDAVQLALVPINFSTAYLMLRQVVPLERGDWVLQNAANSNVGHYVIRLARRWGLRTVNVVRRAELLPALAAAGGDLNLLDGDDLAERACPALGDGRLRLAIDAIAGDAPTRLGRCFGPDGGTIASYGLLSGEPCRIPQEMLMLGGVTLTGFFAARTLRQIGAAAVAQMRADILRALAEEPPQARIAGVYRF